MDYWRDLYDLFWYCAFGDRLLREHVELCDHRGNHGRGWYISVAFHAAIPGRQSAVSLDGRVFCKWTHGPNGGVADSLDEAKVAFRSWRGARSLLCLTLDPINAAQPGD